jgi:hypothetical protein
MMKAAQLLLVVAAALAPSPTTADPTMITTRWSGCTKIWGQTIEYLDRQNVGCSSGEALASFRLTTEGCGGDDMQFKIECIAVPGLAGNEMRKSSCTPHLPGKSLEALDTQNILCGESEVLTAFSFGSGGCTPMSSEMRYTYYCSEYPGHVDSSELNTDCSLISGRTLEFLDRQYVKCGEGELLGGFRLASKDGYCADEQDMRYVARCRTPSPTTADPTPSPTTADPTCVPDFDEKEAIDFVFKMYNRNAGGDPKTLAGKGQKYHGADGDKKETIKLLADYNLDNKKGRRTLKMLATRTVRALRKSQGWDQK